MSTCMATRYAKGPCNGPASFRVVYRSQDGTVIDAHPACFRHGLAEVERHYAAAGMARCDLEESPTREDA